MDLPRARSTEPIERRPAPMSEQRPPSRNPVNRVVDAVVPTVIGAIPVDDVVSRIDVAALLERIEPDDLLARIDLDALLARIDLDVTLSRLDLQRLLTRLDLDEVLAGIDLQGLISQVDLDALLAGIDVDGLVGRIDLDALLARIDVDALVQRIDVDALMARVDIDALLDRVDVDRLIQRVDVEALIARVDVDAIIGRTRVGDIVARSTNEVAESSLDLARRQLVAIDVIVSRAAERVLGRTAARPDGPGRLVGAEPIVLSARGRHQVTGHYAGPVTRLLAYVGDTTVITFLYGFLLAGVAFVAQLLDGGATLPDRQASLLWAAGYGAWYTAYTAGCIAAFGRTPVKAVVGLRVVASDGTPLRARAAVVRALALPLSLALALVALPGVVLGRGRRTLHDLLARSAVVYDWGDRPAELPTPISRYLAARGAVGASSAPGTTEA